MFIRPVLKIFWLIHCTNDTNIINNLTIIDDLVNIRQYDGGVRMVSISLAVDGIIKLVNTCNISASSFTYIQHIKVEFVKPCTHLISPSDSMWATAVIT